VPAGWRSRTRDTSLCLEFRNGRPLRYNSAVEADKALGRCAPSEPCSLTPVVIPTASSGGRSRGWDVPTEARAPVSQRLLVEHGDTDERAPAGAGYRHAERRRKLPRVVEVSTGRRVAGLARVEFLLAERDSSLRLVAFG
jgi:hypothetical protein